MKKKIKKLIHNYISIPRYERKLRDYECYIAELKRDKEFLQSQMYKYKNKFLKLKRNVN